MNCRNFSKFDEWKPARLVWDKGAETPGAAEAKPEAPPADPAAAAAQAEQGVRVAEAVRAGQPDPAAAEAVLAQLGIEVKVAPKEDQTPLTVEQIESALKKANPQQLLALNTSLSVPVTDEETDAFQKKYKSADGPLDLETIGKNISEGKISIRELVVFSKVIDSPSVSALLEKQNENTKKALEAASQRCRVLQGALEKQLKPKFNPEQVDAVFKKEAYQAAYEKFLADPTKKDEFLTAITDANDKAVIEWAITAEPTLTEKTAVATKFKDLIGKNDPAAIGEAVKSQPPKMNFREGMIAKAILDDLQKAAESKENIPDELKGLGFMGLLEKLIEKITKLLEKLSNQIDKAFKKPSEQFATSPIGGDQKFTIETAKAGVNLKAEKAGLEVKHAIPAKGKVVEVGADYVKIQAGKGFAVYSGITPMVTKDAEVSEGTKLGVMKTDVLNFQMIGEDSKQIDPTKLLGKYVKSPETKTVEAPAINVTQSPVAVKAGESLNVAKNFAQSGNTGIELTVAKGTAVQSMSDGIVIESSGDTVEIANKDGKVIVYKGLKDDASRVAVNPNEVIKAGKALGTVSDSGALTIQFLQNGTAADPASILPESVLPKPAAPAPATK